MKIMAICGSGLGSSFMVEMNIKKVLKKLEIEAEVEHSDLSSATPGAADLFVMAKDIAASASVPESQLVVSTISLISTNSKRSCAPGSKDNNPDKARWICLSLKR